MLYEHTPRPTPSLTLQEKLDRLPRDRHVDFIRFGLSPAWYASYKEPHKINPIIMYLGIDTQGKITKWQQEQELRRRARLERVQTRQENRLQRTTPEQCKSGHATFVLDCDDCISRAYAHIAWKRGIEL